MPSASVLPPQVQRLQQENEALVEAERQTAAELGRRLNEIAAQGQAAADSRVDKEMLSAAVETVQVGAGAWAAAPDVPFGVCVFVWRPDCRLRL